MLWNYWAVPAPEMKKITRQGFALWGAPGRDPKQANAFRKALLATGGTGLVMTRWIACRKENRKELVDVIRTVGPQAVGALGRPSHNVRTFRPCACGLRHVRGIGRPDVSLPIIPATGPSCVRARAPR